MSVALIDYGAGNLHSVAKALRHVSEHTVIHVTSDPQVIASADRIVLPGVGAFADCMRGLKSAPGVLDALREVVQEKGRPFLGICVGMQMMLDESHEHGTHNGLGWIPGTVRAIQPRNRQFKIPHMGWNDLTVHHDHPVLKNIRTGMHAYFVHSYHAVCADQSHNLATTDYGTAITAIIAKDNLVGAQFHPEKSKQTGLTLMANFLRM